MVCRGFTNVKLFSIKCQCCLVPEVIYLNLGQSCQWKTAPNVAMIDRYASHLSTVLCLFHVFDVLTCCRKVIWYQYLNSLAPGKFEWNFRRVIFKQILVIDSWGISCEIAIIWMSLGFSDGQSTLVQVMAWCLQATSHYLSHCCPRFLSPYELS